MEGSDTDEEKRQLLKKEKLPISYRKAFVGSVDPEVNIFQFVIQNVISEMLKTQIFNIEDICILLKGWELNHNNLIY